MNKISIHLINPTNLKQWIKAQAHELGFSACGVTHPTINPKHSHYLKNYLEKGHQGGMSYLAENQELRADPTLLLDNVKSIISVRMDYLVEKPKHRYIPLEPDQGVIARYARGRDYHKIIRQRLKHLGQRIQTLCPEATFRPYTDSAPIFEKALAEQAGLGWTGKNALLIHPKAGSFFLLGELFTSLALPADEPFSHELCGSCTACLNVCPTNAYDGAGKLDARKCIAYLTIEYKGSIPVEYRKPIGNRIFGCDDCQLICPWNKFAKPTKVSDFYPRHQLDVTSLNTFWEWSEAEFLAKTEGSPIRRTGYNSFMRNVAIALGNSLPSPQTINLLKQRFSDFDSLIQEHIVWAIKEQKMKLTKGT